MVACLVQIDGYDPIAAAAVTLYAGSHDDPAVCHLNGQTWWPALAKLPTLRYDLFDGSFGGGISTPSSSLTLQAEPWPNLGRYMLADARLRLWTGEPGASWGGYTLRFDGRITGQPKLADGKADIDFAVDDRWLDTAFLATYAGTTGVEGPTGLKGQIKPLALGAPAYVPGKLIDSVNSVFQLSSYGGVQAIATALERLARFGSASADYATYAALIAATLAAGTWATCKAAGLVRFGAPPTGQVSFLLQGDNSGTDGWARKPGQLIRRLALLSGGTGKVDDTSLNALDTARPYNLSLYLDEQTTARDAIQRIAASVNAVAGVSWTGQLFVLPVAIGAASVTLAADGSALPPVASVQQIDIAAPFKKLALTAEKAWTVHQLADIAFTATLIDLGGYSAATTYREGNIVELPTGARYMYSNVTPTAGNSPPNVTYWTALPAAASTDWDSVSNPAGTKPANNAGTAVTLRTVGTAGNITITGNSAVALGAANWTSGAQSREAFTGSAELRFRNTDLGANGLIVAGMIDPANTGAGFSSFAGPTILAASGTAYVLNAAGIPLYTSAGGFYAATDFLSVVYLGSRWSYRKNDVEFHTAAATAGQTYVGMISLGVTGKFADADFSSYGDITDVQPVTSLLDKTTGQALNSRILKMRTGAASAVYDINPLSASRTAGVTTISIAAHQFKDDVSTLSFSAGSVGGLTAAVGEMYAVYEVNTTYAGGARTYLATLDLFDVTANPDHRFVGLVEVPPNGGTTTGAGNGSAGGKGRDADEAPI